MSKVALAKQIADDLASARCLQDLDIELSKIVEHDWLIFMEHMQDELEVVDKNEPERAQFLRSLLHSYTERRQYLKG